ncbi:MAG TPA: exo-alpha-sialidase [Candidatus Thermoplasmatota archaeon]|nr:exo-alpha-sialidase [Candidatus Thermoplasmatota archaeon]
MSVKKGDTVVLAGTKKGLFVLHSRDRKKWKTEGPYFEGLEVYHAASDGKKLWTSVNSMHWGPTVQRSSSWGARWQNAKEPPRYEKDTGLSVARVWNLAPTKDGTLYAGVEPAGLFTSDDDGDTWKSVATFNEQPGRKDWMPGGGGLCMHTILPYPGDAKRMIAAASAVGIFGTKDGWKSWTIMNGGINAPWSPTKVSQEGVPGTCPHKLVRDAKDPTWLYMQNHGGVYKRKMGEDTWTPIMKGLPGPFGFAMVAHPHEAGTVYTVPLEADVNRVTPGGALSVYRTDNAGKSWKPLTKGLPKKGAFLTVLREGMATDGKDPAGLYVGTTGGHLFASRDDGRSWDTLAQMLPPILSVQATVAR